MSAIPADSGLVLVRGDRLDAVFPVAPINPNGCNDSASTKPTVSFNWSVGYRVPPLPDLSDLSRIHDPHAVYALLLKPSKAVFTRIDVELPRSAQPTEERLDSAFARRAVAVWTYSSAGGFGDGSPTIELVEPELRAIYFDHARMHFVIKGAAALAAFLALEPDSVQLHWCAARGRSSATTVPLIRR